MSTRTLNKIVIIGNVGEDAKLSTTSTGTPVCFFRVATNHTWSPKDSEKVHEETQWHNVVTFGKFAEICHQLVKKSLKVYVEGRLKSTEFQNDDGSTTTKIETVGSKMIILDGEHKDTAEAIDEDIPFESYANY